jgi:hypothetical protein
MWPLIRCQILFDTLDNYQHILFSNYIDLKYFSFHFDSTQVARRLRNTRNFCHTVFWQELLNCQTNRDT